MKIEYSVGDNVAVHFKKDKCGLDSFFDYPKNGSYKKCKVINVKKHWNWFFKTMYLLDDGKWYSFKDLTMIIKCAAVCK